MKPRFGMAFVSMVLLSAAPSVYPEQAGSIGYPSVKAAIESLKKKPGVEISDNKGWTIITEKGDKQMVLWSFAPQSDPAYPAVARREMVEKDGGMYVDLTVLCEASKAACDILRDQFEQLDEQMAQGAQSAAAPPAEKWAPDEAQITAANDLAREYLKLRDGGRYQEAYALLAPGMQSRMSFMEWSRRSEEFRLESGGNPVHEIIKLTWHKDPPDAEYPGVYAAFDLNCRYTNIDHCTETLILHQQDSGEFRVMRHEQNIVDKGAENKFLETPKKNSL